MAFNVIPPSVSRAVLVQLEADAQSSENDAEAAQQAAEAARDLALQYKQDAYNSAQQAAQQQTGDFTTPAEVDVQIDNKLAVYSGDWTNLTNKPTAFTPSAHTHAQADITDLTTDLAARALNTSFDALQYTGETNLNNYSGNFAFKTPASGLTNLPAGWAQTTYVLQNMGDSDESHQSQLIITDSPAMKAAIRKRSASVWGTWLEVGISDWADIQNKPVTFNPSAHGHTWGEITGKPANFTPSAHGHTWGEITGKPASFTPSAHGHTWGEITGKPATFTPAPHTHSRLIAYSGYNGALIDTDDKSAVRCEHNQAAGDPYICFADFTGHLLHFGMRETDKRLHEGGGTLGATERQMVSRNHGYQSNFTGTITAAYDDYGSAGVISFYQANGGVVSFNTPTFDAGDQLTLISTDPLAGGLHVKNIHGNMLLNDGTSVANTDEIEITKPCTVVITRHQTGNNDVLVTIQ